LNGVRVKKTARVGWHTMCNLYSITTPVADMRRLFDVSPENDLLGNFRPLEAVFPKHHAPVVRLDTQGERQLVAMEWGFATPKISKKTGKPISPYAWNNARDENLLKSRLWRDSFVKRRCLVPVSSFQESKGKAPATNVWFAMNSDDETERPLFAFAGLWRHHQFEMQDKGADKDTFTVITTSANELIKPVHPNRMPVILGPGSFDSWLNGTETDALNLLKPYSSDEMRIAKEGVGIWSDPQAHV
jgi:putative SOS response-associated peptidase YedK